MLETDILNTILNDILHNDINSIKKISLINRYLQQAVSNLSKTDIIADKLNNISQFTYRLPNGFRAKKYMYEAAKKGYMDIVKLMMEKASCYDLDWGMYNGGKIYADDFKKMLLRDNRTVCMFGAIDGGHIDIVQYMIEKGALRSIHWNLGISRAAKRGHMDIVILMVEKGETRWNDIMCSAAEGGHMDIVQFVIGEGALRSSDFDNAMYYAAMKGHIDIIKFLIEKGATDLDTAMYIAQAGGHIDIFKLLEQHIV